MENISERIIQALSNKEQKPPPDTLPPVEPGQTVIGTLSPAAQALYCLITEVQAEGKAENDAKTGTEACGTTCSCSAYMNRVENLHRFLAFIVGEEMGRPDNLNVDIRADWTLIESDLDETFGLFSLPPELERLFRGGGDATGRNSKVQEV